jgi:ParB-like chromosome segregation protein Spo0J
MEIPESVIGWGLASLATMIGWLIRLEARLNARPTRIEQEAAHAKVAATQKEGFEEIKRMLERQNEGALLHRQWVGDSLAEIRTKVAVLRDRAGDVDADEPNHPTRFPRQR